MVIGMELLPLPSWCCGTADASVKSVVNKNVTIDAVKFLAVRALEEVFVDVQKQPLTSKAISFLLFVGNFDEVCDREEMVIRSGEMWSEDECQAADDTLDGQFTVLCLTLWAIVAGS